MNESSLARSSRRRVLGSGLSLLGLVPVLGAASLLSGCGDNKGDMTPVENPVSPAEKGKDSMNFYKDASKKNKGGAIK
jgi:hypothetical protein